MTKCFAWALALVLVFPGSSWGAEEKKADSSKPDEADQVITNRRLRADAGSLSPWSASTFFNYQGGSIADPGKPERPNIVSGADALTLQNMTGEIGIRYRVTTFDSFTLSTGLFMTTPFHDDIDTDNPVLEEEFERTHQKLTVNDPSLRYTRVGKLGPAQSVLFIKPKLITNNQQKNAGYNASYEILQQYMVAVPETRFSYGVGFLGTFYTFNNDNRFLARNVWGVFPGIEYDINDTFNFRTIWGWQVYQNARFQGRDTFTKRKVYQSMGLGISVTRDVFLYPNIQFIPSDLRSDRTNIAISANVNVF